MIILEINGAKYETMPSKKHLMKAPYKQRSIKQIKSVLPCTVTEIFVKEGQKVKSGDKLLIFESMKMANELRAEIDGEIKSIEAKIGERITKNTHLIEFV